MKNIQPPKIILGPLLIFTLKKATFRKLKQKINLTQIQLISFVFLDVGRSQQVISLFFLEKLLFRFLMVIRTSSVAVYIFLYFYLEHLVCTYSYTIARIPLSLVSTCLELTIDKKLMNISCLYIYTAIDKAFLMICNKYL